MENYRIYNLNDGNLRVDLFNGTTLKDIPELATKTIKVLNTWGNMVKISVTEQTKKVTAKIERFGHDKEDGEDKVIQYWISCNDEEILLNLESKMFEECYEDMDDGGVLEYNEYKDVYMVSLNIEYEYGRMQEIDKEVRRAFKQVKKELGIR